MSLPSRDHDDLRSATRDVLAAHSSPARIRAQAESSAKTDADLWKLGSELGWNSLTVPEEFDGLGLSIVEATIVAEEFGRVAQASPLPATIGTALILSEFGSYSLRQRWLPLVAEGAAVMSWATSVGATRPTTGLTLREAGDGFVLDGTIEWLPDGPDATGFLVTARFGDRDVAVMLAITDEGVDVSPLQSLDIGRLHGRLTCSRVVVATDSVLRDGAAEMLFDVAVTLQCAETLGLSNTLLAMTVDYLQTRVQFGQQIGKFQVLKHRIADMLMHCESARVTTWEAAAVIADSLNGGNADSAEGASVAKSIVGRAGDFVASEALQLHGGIGFTWEHDLHLFLRRAKVNELLLGTPRWHEERLTSIVGARTQAR